jgi:DNA-binding NarL/FixJ family response regulator
MFKTAVSVQMLNRLYLFIGHPRNPFVQHLHSAITPQENLSLTMRPDSKLLDPSLHYAAYILDADYLEDAPSVIRTIRRRNPQARVLVIAKAPSWDDMRELFRAGAIDVLPCPANAEATRVLLEQMMESYLPGDCRA